MNPGGPQGATDFLIQVARKRGRLGKGGIPDLNSAARAVVNDWCDGRLQWFTTAPEPREAASSGAGDAAATTAPVAGNKEIVSQWAAEFDLGGLYSAENAEEENEGAMEQ